MGAGVTGTDMEPGDRKAGTKGFSEAEGSDGAVADQGPEDPGARQTRGSGAEETGNSGAEDTEEGISGPKAVTELGAKVAGDPGNSGM